MMRVRWIAGLALATWCSLPAGAQDDEAAERLAAAGQQAMAQGQYAAAEESFAKLAKLEPGVAEVHATLAVVYYSERKYAEAVSAGRAAQKLKPGLPKLDSLISVSLAELGRFPEALPGLEKNFKQSTDPEVKRMCGLQLLRAFTALRRDGEAVETSLALNRQFPDDPEVLYHTGRIFGNYAYLVMLKLHDKAPGSIWMVQAAGEAHESQGQNALAIADYRKVLELDPHHPGMHYRLGRVLLAESHQGGGAKDIDEALREFETELQTDAGNGNAAYEIGEIHRGRGEFGEAEKYFRMAVKNYPEFLEARQGLAANLMAEQKPELALPELQKALELDPQSEVSWYRLSQVDRSLGDKAGQAKAMKEFRRLHQAQAGQAPAAEVAAHSEVTQQTVDANATP